MLVWLTDAGRDVVSRIGNVLAPDLLERVMAGLAPADRAAVVRGFELLAHAEPGPAPAGPLAGPSVNPSPERRPR